MFWCLTLKVQVYSRMYAEGQTDTSTRRSKGVGGSPWSQSSRRRSLGEDESWKPARAKEMGFPWQTSFVDIIQALLLWLLLFHLFPSCKTDLLRGVNSVFLSETLKNRTILFEIKEDKPIQNFHFLISFVESQGNLRKKTKYWGTWVYFKNSRYFHIGALTYF